MGARKLVGACGRASKGRDTLREEHGGFKKRSEIRGRRSESDVGIAAPPPPQCAAMNEQYVQQLRPHAEFVRAPRMTKPAASAGEAVGDEAGVHVPSGLGGHAQDSAIFWGQPMNIVLPDQVCLSLYRYGFVEEGLTRLVLEYLKPGDTFFDVGCTLGISRCWRRRSWATAGRCNTRSSRRRARSRASPECCGTRECAPEQHGDVSRGDGDPV